MDFYTAVKSRRTIRDFTQEPVELEAVKRILSAGLAAPTNDHMRNWEFVLVTDKQTIGEILALIPKKFTKEMMAEWKFPDEIQQKMYDASVPKQHQMLSASQCLILPFFKQTSPLLSPDSLSSLNAFASIWCCIENILLAATAENLGAALRIPLQGESEQIFKVIKHPNEYALPCYVALGHPAPDATPVKQNPCTLDGRLHINKW